MSEIQLEKSEMSSVGFCQSAMKKNIAPPEFGSVKERINRAAYRLHWSVSRTKDVWYADARASIKADELTDVERVAGVFYAARNQLRENEEIERRIAAILERENATVIILLAAAIRQSLGLGDSA